MGAKCLVLAQWIIIKLQSPVITACAAPFASAGISPLLGPRPHRGGLQPSTAIPEEGSRYRRIRKPHGRSVAQHRTRPPRPQQPPPSRR